MAFSTIDKSTSFQTQTLYTGNGSTQSITGVGFRSDMLWIKCRTALENHCLVDSVRGDSGETSGYWELRPDTTQASVSGSYNALVTAIGADGFSVGINDVVNTNTKLYIGWNWLMGTTTGIAGSPSITPQSYSFNATAGQSIIKWEGTGVAATLPHGLGAVPKMILFKRLDATAQWVVYHVATGNTQALYLNTNAAPTVVSGFFNDTTPTSSLFSVGTDAAVNGNAEDYIAYCWAEIPGYSKFGTYTGNGNADGTFVYTGMRPQYLLIKQYDTTRDWNLFDNARNTFNVIGEQIEVNTTSAGDSYTTVDFVSNGFKFRTSDAGKNEADGTYIYAAFGQPIISNSGVCANAR